MRLRGLPVRRNSWPRTRAALTGPRAVIGAGRIKPGSVAAVVAEYLDSQQFFASKSAGTQRMRRGILERFRAAYGDRPLRYCHRSGSGAAYAKPPYAARSWLVTLRSLCQFAVKRGWLRADPTANIKLRAIKSDGFHTWTEDEIAQFEAHHPIGTKPRLALALLLYTAQRRGDVVRMGRQHIRDGVLTVKQQKTGSTLVIPVHPELHAVLDATPGEHLTFLITATGKPYGGTNSASGFGSGATPPDSGSTVGAWTPQGGMSETGRGRMQRQTKYCRHQRARQLCERGRAIHQGRGSSSHGAQCDVADGSANER